MILTMFMMGDERLRSVTIAILFPFKLLSSTLLVSKREGKGRGVGRVSGRFIDGFPGVSILSRFSHENFLLFSLSVIFHFFLVFISVYTWSLPWNKGMVT